MLDKTNPGFACQFVLFFDNNNSTALPETKRTIVAAILHATQEGIQSQMATKIELEVAACVSELHAEDIALYRISGWDLKSCIDNVRKNLKLSNTDTHFQQLDLLLPLQRPNSTKDSLPLGAQYLDHAGLTLILYNSTSCHG